MKNLKKAETILEDRYAHDEEVRFRVSVRRNRLVGLWAAKLLSVSDADSYAETLVAAYFDVPGDDAIVERMHQDFSTAGIELSRHDIRVKMVECLFVAADQIEAA